MNLVSTSMSYSATNIQINCSKTPCTFFFLAIKVNRYISYKESMTSQGLASY